MKHTPGPWGVDSKVKSAIGKGPKNIAMVNFYKSAPPDPERDVAEEEHEANAHLIASAPELLDELTAADEAICSMCIRLNPQHKDCTSCPERDIRVAVIAKARGES